VSRRGTVAGLPSPHPLGARLPAMFATDRLALGIVEACDEVLAPVLLVLDTLDSYVDPALAPPDFVAWLGSWIGEAAGAEPDSPAGQARLRAAVGAAGRRLGRAGTPDMIAATVAQVVGVEPSDVDIVDSGGATWSAQADAALPGQSVIGLAVRVHVADPQAVDHAALEAAVIAAKPAHVPHTISVVPKVVTSDGAQ